jgi:signal transduction histidine kinase
MDWARWNPRTRPAWQRYAVAVSLTLVIIVGRLALDPIWGRLHNRHLVFLPTVMLSAWFGGLGPGLVSAALATVALDYLWTGAEHGFIHPESLTHDLPDLALFLMSSVAICILIESLHAARRMANVATKAREEVLAVVAHDLRNPLQTIKMASTNLERRASGDPYVNENAARIRRASSRMENLIRDLVDATRMTFGELSIDVAPCDVKQMVQEIADELAPIASTKGITIEVDASDGTTVCDRARILQVLANLGSNALAFTPRSGHITLRAAKERDGQRFEVADSGAGIRPEDLPHVFERRWKKSGQGLGLGLFIADGIVRAHGGRLEVESEVGHGSCFHFTLS